MVTSSSVFSDYLSEHKRTIDALEAAVAEPFERLVTASVASLKNGGKILFFGNGGSAADAQHLATELVVRFHENRPSIPAIALTTDTSALTAIGNDFGFLDLFSRQVEGLGNKGDVAIGISTSGNSGNVLKALETAKAKGIVTVGFGGGTGGKMVPLCDISLIVPSPVTARIQECHILLGHMLCAAIEKDLGFIK